MTIVLDGGTGLFDKLGKLKYLLNLINTNIGDTSTGWPKELNDALVEYDAESNAVRDTVRDLLPQLTSAQQGVGGFKDSIRSAARNTLIQIANADDPLPELSVVAALKVLIQQMLDANETVDASEPTIDYLITGQTQGDITAATAANPVEITDAGHGLVDGDVISIFGVVGMTELNGRRFTINQTASNTFELIGINGSGYTAYSSGGVWKKNHGTGVIVTSVLDGKGQRLENVLAEDIVVTCDNATTAGAEQFTALGELPAASKLDHLWPAGSGTNQILSTNTAGGTNLLTNGDFETFTVTNTPDDWTLDTGTATADFLEENTTILRDTSSLEIDGDGSTLQAISQTITGLSSRTPYAFNLWAALDVVPAAGVLVADLYDGSAVINDDQGTANSLTIPLTTHGLYWTPHYATFHLPEPVPATVKLRLRLTTALSSTSSVFIDEVCLVAATQLYTEGGPFVAIFAGGTDFALDDEFLVQPVNARAGALQEMCDQFFDTASEGLLIPSDTGAAETVADSVIG